MAVVDGAHAALVLLLAFDSRLSCLMTLLQHHWASCLGDQPWPSNLVNFNTLIPWLSRTSCKSWHNYSLCHNIAAGRTYTLVCSDHPPCLTTRNKTKDFALVKMNCGGDLGENLSLRTTYTTKSLIFGTFLWGHTLQRITQLISQLPGNSCSNTSLVLFISFNDSCLLFSVLLSVTLCLKKKIGWKNSYL